MGQGPFMAPAASELGADQTMTTMGAAYGEQVANMLQPFWALPVLAIVGLGIRQTMGYEVLAFVIVQQVALLLTHAYLCAA